MKEESKRGFYAGNYFPHYMNNGSPYFGQGIHPNPFMNYSNTNYPRVNIFQNMNNMNSLNYNQLMIQMQNLKKEIEDIKLKGNIQKENFNNQINALKNNYEKKMYIMGIEMNNLRAFDEKIIKKLDEIETIVKSMNVHEITDSNLNTEIKSLNEKLKSLELQLRQLKEDMEEKNKKNLEEVNRLEKEIISLKIRIKELQGILVGRKILKILLKIIIKNCFDNYYGQGTVINVQKLIEPKYFPYIKIANNLIDIVLTKNKIIHINNEINNIIDIINENSTYGDILLLVKNVLKKNDYENIQNLLNEKLLFNQICKDEIIGIDEEISTIINKKYK